LPAFQAPDRATLTQKEVPVAPEGPPTGLRRLSVAAGARFFNVDDTESAEALAVRYLLSPRETRWGSFSVELGGQLPQDTSGSFRQRQGSFYQASVDSISEADFSLVDEFSVDPDRVIAPYLGLGLSVARITDRFDIQPPPVPATGPSLFRTTSWSPFVTLGLRIFPASIFSLRLDVSFVDFANAFDAQGQHIDLRLSGWMLRPMIQVRL
jgi:outer membrane protein W